MTDTPSPLPESGQNIIRQLKQIAENDWSIVRIAHTSDTAVEAIKEIERLRSLTADMLAALEKAFAVLGSKELDGVFSFCFAHGYRYSGPSINIDELRSAITAAGGDRSNVT